MSETDLVVGSIRLWRAPEKVEITVEAAVPASEDARVEEVWARLCAANPKLHDGPMLSVTSFDTETGCIYCRPDSYKRLAVQIDGGPDTGVWLFAVKGIIIAADESHRKHVLMIRRHKQTRMYGGMWEIGPAGGVDLSDPAVQTLGIEELVVQVRRELREEAGISSPLGNASLAAFFTDERSRSMDVVIQAELQEPIEQIQTDDHEWDGVQSLWLPIAEVEQFVRKERANIVDNSLGLMRLLGWAQ